MAKVIFTTVETVAKVYEVEVEELKDLLVNDCNYEDELPEDIEELVDLFVEREGELYLSPVHYRAKNVVLTQNVLPLPDCASPRLSCLRLSNSSPCNTADPSPSHPSSPSFYTPTFTDPWTD